MIQNCSSFFFYLIGLLFYYAVFYYATFVKERRRTRGANDENYKDYRQYMKSLKKPLCHYSFTILPVGSLGGNFEALRARGGVPLERVMRFEGQRLASFWKVEILQSPIKLAAAGFYATEDGDETRCFSCGQRHRNWDWTHPPSRHHHKPDCMHALGDDRDNVTMQENSLPSELDARSFAIHVRRVLPAPLTGTGIGRDRLTVSRERSFGEVSDGSPPLPTRFPEARYPCFLEVSARVQSFRSWPDQHQSPLNLAQAGFFCSGRKDLVRCFACGLGLMNWEADDDPLVEHIRFRPSCPYIKKVTGEHTSRPREYYNHQREADPDPEVLLTSHSDPREENRDLKCNAVCKICFDYPASIVFLPCGHLVLCENCAPALHNCPVCRCLIGGTVRVHFA